MDVAVLEGLRSLRLRKRRITAPKEDEVQLQINCVPWHHFCPPTQGALVEVYNQESSYTNSN